MVFRLGLLLLTLGLAGACASPSHTVWVIPTLFADSSELPAAESWQFQSVFDDTYERSLQRTISVNSYGRFRLAGTVMDPQRVGFETDYCTPDSTCWLNQGLLQVAQAAVGGVLSDAVIPNVILITLPDVPTAMGAVQGKAFSETITLRDGAGRTFDAQVFVIRDFGPNAYGDRARVLLHEFAHLLGADHAGVLDCTAANGPIPDSLPEIIKQPFIDAPYAWTPLLEPYGCDVTNGALQYGDSYDVMGRASLSHLSALNKLKSGMIAANEVADIAIDVPVTDLTIRAVEDAEPGVKLVRIPIEHGHFYVVEYRLGSQIDVPYCPGSVCPPLSHEVVVRVGLREGATQLTGIGSLFPAGGVAVLGAGESYHDLARGIRVEALSAKALASVRILRIE